VSARIAACTLSAAGSVTPGSGWTSTTAIPGATEGREELVRDPVELARGQLALDQVDRGVLDLARRARQAERLDRLRHRLAARIVVPAARPDLDPVDGKRSGRGVRRGGHRGVGRGGCGGHGGISAKRGV
jgi:hypothetical protein